jgi:hypothetical protein
MGLSPPGHDPVADHIWCCEHPEPWHYFQTIPYQRLLSAIERVYRVDPVEASWCLGILEWTATPEAIPLLERILIDRAVPPKQQRKIRHILKNLETQTATSHGDIHDEDLDQFSIPELLKTLQQTVDPLRRKKAINLLVDAFPASTSKPYTVEILSEVLSEQHPSGADLVATTITPRGSASLNPEDRAQLFLACATWIHPTALETIHLLLESTQGGLPIYDTYEGIKALCLNPQTKPNPIERKSLYEHLLGQNWYQAKCAEEAGQMGVISSALLEEQDTDFKPWKQRFRWPGKSGVLRRYLAERRGFLHNPRSERWLKRMLRDREISVRRQAARSLTQIGSNPCVDSLIEHVAKDIITGRVPFDIEGVDVVRHTIDMVVRSQNPAGMDLLTTLLHTPTMRADDLPSRTAVALCVLDQDHCMRRRDDNHLPEILHAALTPLPSTPGSLLDQHTYKAAQWMKSRFDAPFSLTSLPLSHLARVRLSQDMLAWWLAREPTTG